MDAYNGMDHSEGTLSDSNIDDLGLDWNGVIKNSKPTDSQVLFYWEGKKNEAKSNLAGHPVYDPEIFISIRSKSGLSVVTKKATEAHIAQYPMQYRQFQRTEQKIDGLPLKEWPPITRVQMMNLNAAGIRSVEQLRDASEEKLKFLGSEGRLLQEQAQAYFEAAKDASKVIRQAKELSQRDNEIQSLKAQLAAANAQVQELRAQGQQISNSYQPIQPQIDINALTAQITAAVRAQINLESKQEPTKKRGMPKGGWPKKTNSIIEEETQS